MVEKPRVKGEELRELFVGISALKASLKQNVESLLSGEVDHIVILRNNKAVGVMLSFEDYQEMKETVAARHSLVTEEDELTKRLMAKYPAVAASEPKDA